MIINILAKLSLMKSPMRGKIIIIKKTGKLKSISSELRLFLIKASEKKKEEENIASGLISLLFELYLAAHYPVQTLLPDSSVIDKKAAVKNTGAKMQHLRNLVHFPTTQIWVNLAMFDEE